MLPPIIKILSLKKYDLKKGDFAPFLKLLLYNLKDEEVLTILANLDALAQSLQDLERDDEDGELRDAFREILKKEKESPGTTRKLALSIIARAGSMFEDLKFIRNDSIYEVNDYITLKLEGNRTNIYVKGSMFNQCKYLLINISTDKVRDYDQIGSIDEAEDFLSNKMESNHGIVPPQTEFWGHCSNIQAWVENDYDTRILHRNMAFPLLRRLVQAGEPRAKAVYKDEIARRIQSGHLPVFTFLLQGHYIDNLDKNELTYLMDNIDLEKLFEHSESRNFFRPSRGRESVGFLFLRELAERGIQKARTFLKQKFQEELSRLNPVAIRQLTIKPYSEFFTLQEITNLYQKANKKEFSRLKPEIKLDLLRILRQLGVKEAGKEYKSILMNLFRTASKNPRQAMMLRPFLAGLKESFLNTLYRLANTSRMKDRENRLNIMKMFSDFQVSGAIEALENEIKQAFKVGDVNIINIMCSRGILARFKQELPRLTQLLDLEAIFNSKQHRISLNLLRFFKNQGIHKAEKLFYRKVKAIFQDSAANDILFLIDRKYLDDLTDNELKTAYKATQPSVTQEILAEIIRFEKSSRKWRTNKIREFLSRLKLLDPELLSKRIKKTILKADFDHFRNLIRINALSYVTNADFEVMKEDASCFLNRFHVSFNGVIYLMRHDLHLNLANKGISDLREVKNLNRLKQLKSIDLRNNYLRRLRGIGNLANLSQISVSGNPLKPHILQKLGGLDEQGHLLNPRNYLIYSRLRDKADLQKVIVKGKLYMIYKGELLLSNLGIKSTEEIKGFKELKELKVLDLSYNELEQVPEIKQFTNLKILNLQHNNLKNVEIISSLSSLEEIRLYGNDLISEPEVKHISTLKKCLFGRKRGMPSRTFLERLISSLTINEMKAFAKRYGLKRYSYLSRRGLITFISNNLNEDQVYELIYSVEERIVRKHLNQALKIIARKSSEKLKSLEIIDEKNLEVEITTMNYKRPKKRRIRVSMEALKTPEMYCDCSVGRNLGFCKHFWLAIMCCMKKGLLNASNLKVINGEKLLKSYLDQIQEYYLNSEEFILIKHEKDLSLMLKLINNKIEVKSAVLREVKRKDHSINGMIQTVFIAYLENVKFNAIIEGKRLARWRRSASALFSYDIQEKLELKQGMKINFSAMILKHRELGIVLGNVINFRAQKTLDYYF